MTIKEIRKNAMKRLHELKGLKCDNGKYRCNKDGCLYTLSELMKMAWKDVKKVVAQEKREQEAKKYTTKEAIKENIESFLDVMEASAWWKLAEKMNIDVATKKYGYAILKNNEKIVYEDNGLGAIHQMIQNL